MVDSRLLTLVLVTAFVLMAGWLLVLGQATILPIVGGLISVYVLSAAADVRRVPILGAAPLWLRRILVLLGFVAAIAVLGLMVVLNLQGVMAALPGYEKNLISLVSSITEVTIVIILAAMESTRPIAIMLSIDGEV